MYVCVRTQSSKLIKKIKKIKVMLELTSLITGVACAVVAIAVVMSNLPFFRS